MKTLISTLLVLSIHAAAPALAQPASPSEAVTVVIQINLNPGSPPPSASGPMNDMRALIKKQPGYLGGESLQNNNPSNSPAFVHVTRWAALKYWENVYLSPEFSQLNAAGAKHYSVSISAFKALK